MAPIFCGVLNHRLNKQLAADLGVCERTIKAQRARMLDKLQIQTVPELVRAATSARPGQQVEDRILQAPRGDREHESAMKVRRQ